MNAPDGVLVVGASAAGLATAEALRRKGYDGPPDGAGRRAAPAVRPAATVQTGPRRGLAAGAGPAAHARRTVHFGRRVRARRPGRRPGRRRTDRAHGCRARADRGRRRARHRAAAAHAARPGRPGRRPRAAHPRRRAGAARGPAARHAGRGRRRRRARRRDRRHRTRHGPRGHHGRARSRRRWPTSSARSPAGLLAELHAANGVELRLGAGGHRPVRRRTAGSPACAWRPARCCRPTWSWWRSAPRRRRNGWRAAVCCATTAWCATPGAARRRGSTPPVTWPAGTTRRLDALLRLENRTNATEQAIAVAANILGDDQPVHAGALLLDRPVRRQDPRARHAARRTPR